jgi:hypothetical protein
MTHPHEERYWRAYEWAHNVHHPAAPRLDQFAKAFADEHDQERTTLALRDYWQLWEDGKTEEPSMLGYE